MTKNPALIDVATSMFAPGDVERICGLNLSTLRSWRHKGWIPAKAMLGTVNGFHLVDLCQIALLNVYGKNGGAVARLHSRSSAMAGDIYRNVLLFEDMWDTPENHEIYVNEKLPALPVNYGVITETAINSVGSLDDHFSRAHPAISTVIDYGKIAGEMTIAIGKPIATLTVHDLIERDGKSVFVNRATGKAVE
jgi:hypothetical protein